jgi:hypothetical protein
MQDYLRWRSANARHPDVLAACAANVPASQKTRDELAARGMTG